MKIAAFLQLYNELEKGNLVRCLENCKKWADEIFIYDDCSTDNSKDVYLKYTDKDKIIFGKTREFNKEIYHKQQLLELTLTSSPDWIVWQDGDAILDRQLTNNLKSILQDLDNKGVDGAYVHYLNLWRSNSYHRVDNSYDLGWFLLLWKNTGALYYEPKKGLHLDQFPLGIKNPIKIPHTVVHYGFSTKEKIENKYLTYKSYGQHGHSLERLIDEQSSFNLVKMDVNSYPEENVPTNYDTEVKPLPISFKEVRK